MLAAIGETFDPLLTSGEGGESPTSLITGVIVSTRPQFYRISIWTRSAPTLAGGEDEKLKERIDQLRAMDNSAFLALPASDFTERAVRTQRAACSRSHDATFLHPHMPRR